MADDAQYGHIIGGAPNPDYAGGVLTVDLAIGDIVVYIDDVADFNEDAALVDGAILVGLDFGSDGEPDLTTPTKLGYLTATDNAEVDGSDGGNLTLAAPSTVAASAGDRVYVFDPSSDGPIVDYQVFLAQDEGDTSGDALVAILEHGLIDMVGDSTDLSGRAVKYIEDDDGELVVIDIIGSARTAGKVRGYQDEGTATVDGADVVVNLTYRPIPDTTVHVYWHPAGLGGLFQRDANWDFQ